MNNIKSNKIIIINPRRFNVDIDDNNDILYIILLDLIIKLYVINIYYMVEII